MKWRKEISQSSESNNTPLNSTQNEDDKIIQQRIGKPPIIQQRIGKPPNEDDKIIQQRIGKPSDKSDVQIRDKLEELTNLYKPQNNTDNKETPTS